MFENGKDFKFNKVYIFDKILLYDYRNAIKFYDHKAFFSIYLLIKAGFLFLEHVRKI